MRPGPILAAILALVAAAAPAGAQTVPYSFPVTPTDQLAVPGEAAGTEVTPEGYLYTGFTELAYWIGPRLRPFDQPIRSLEEGRYPIVRATDAERGVLYTVEALATGVGDQAADFVRVELRNPTDRPVEARFATAVRWSGGRLRPNGIYQSRFVRPVTNLLPGLYYQPGSEFDPNARYEFAGNAVLRDGQALYLFPDPPRGTLGEQMLRPDPLGPVRADTAFGQVSYRVPLAPGQAATLDFVLPVRPQAPDAPALRRLAITPYEVARARTKAFWSRLLARGMTLELPEEKVEDTFYASIVNAAMVRYPIRGAWNQPVNKLQYHSFWLRDAAIINRLYEFVGLFDIARENLRFFARWQQPDGLYISRPGQLDGHGQALWALGEYVRRSKDAQFARETFADIRRAMTWLIDQRAGDELGLMPSTTIGDAEATSGRITGDNLWAIAGVEAAVDVARLLGEDRLAERWTQEARDFRNSLDAAVDRAAAGTGGALPPALDGPGGQDFNNLALTYPTRVYAPRSPETTATLRRMDRKTREGLMTYDFATTPDLIHHSLGFRLWQTRLERGEQRRVLAALYAALAHTTATNGGFELANGRRVSDNLTPNGWFASEYVALLRNMLVREDARGLTLFSALAPQWMRYRRGGGRIVVRNAPTLFGAVDLNLRPTATGAELSWQAQVPRGTRLTWPVPAWARNLRSTALEPGGRRIVLPGRSGRIRVRWKIATRAGDPSYESAVAALLRKYRAGPGREQDDVPLPG